MTVVYSIDAINWKTLLFLTSLLLTFLLIAWIAWIASKKTESTKEGKVIAITFALMLPMIVLLLLSLQLFLVTAKISNSMLSVGGGQYSKSIPISQLHLDKIVKGANLSGQYSLSRRTNGVGMPGLSLGWFVRKDGKRVFAAISQHEKVIIIPTTKGYDLYVSPDNPDEFVESLHKASQQ
jgi:hypothetical protein